MVIKALKLMISPRERNAHQRRLYSKSVLLEYSKVYGEKVKDETLKENGEGAIGVVAKEPEK